MNTKKRTKVKLSEMSQSDQTRALVALLKSQPDILQREPKLLEILSLEDPQDGNITSLVRRQSERLKDELAENKRRTKEFIDNAKHYEVLTQKIYDLIYDLMACTRSEEVIDIIAAKSPPLFGVNFVEIRGTLDLGNIDSLSKYFNHGVAEHDAYQHIMERLAQGKCLCSDRFPDFVLDYFFTDHNAEIKSVAFVPLIGKDNNPKNSFGVLAYASSQQSKFSSGIRGTVHLERIGKISALSLERFSKQVT